MQKPSNNLKEFLYIIMHIPKTGGTTIARHIKENFPEDARMLLYLSNVEKCFSASVKRNIEQEIQQRGIAKHKVHLIGGHDPFLGIHAHWGKQPRYILFLREPVAWVLSCYNYYRTLSQRHSRLPKTSLSSSPHRGNGLSFEQWIWRYRARSNYVTRFLAGRFYHKPYHEKITKNDVAKIKKVLTSFYFVGITEHEEDYLFLYDLLGIRRFFQHENVSFKYVTETPELRKKILQHNQYDQEIYLFAQTLNRTFKQEHPSFYWSVHMAKRRKKMDALKRMLSTPLMRLEQVASHVKKRYVKKNGKFLCL